VSGFADHVQYERDNPETGSRTSVTGRVILMGEPVHVLDIRNDPEYSWKVGIEGDYRSLLGVPIKSAGDLVGVITLARLEVRPYSEGEIGLVTTFAEQAAIAIANARLLETIDRQRGELASYVSSQVATLVTSPDGERLLAGHRRRITAVFCDLRGFTGFSETAEPEEVLRVLRDYHAALGALIVEHGGTLEHFAGDGTMVFFNDPVEQPDHETRAVRMAVAMRERVGELAIGWHRLGYDLGFGVGISAGYATMGRIGFEGRYDYGAVGNAVILASRLSAEAAAGQILLDQRTFAAVEEIVEVEPVGDLHLKGISRTVSAYDVVALRSAATPAA
jgi:adenylate cyclase